MSLIRSVNNDLKCGQFAPAGGGQFAPAKVVKINRQGVVSLLWRGLLFLSGLSRYSPNVREIIDNFQLEKPTEELNKNGKLYQLVETFTSVDLHTNKNDIKINLISESITKNPPVYNFTGGLI